MTVQNRFAIDMLRGPDQGVCEMIGSDCCTIIPLHTGPAGPLDTLLSRMQAARDEMVSNNASSDPDWLDWLFSTDWLAGLIRIRTAILIVLLVIALIVCCGLPCLHALLDKIVHSLFGQYMQLHMQDMSDPDLKEDLQDARDDTRLKQESDCPLLDNIAYYC